MDNNMCPKCNGLIDRLDDIYHVCNNCGIGFRVSLNRFIELSLSDEMGFITDLIYYSGKITIIDDHSRSNFYNLNLEKNISSIKEAYELLIKFKENLEFY